MKLSLATLAALILALVSACKSSLILRSKAEAPENSPYNVEANVAAHNRGYYAVDLVVRNQSGESLTLGPSMFRLEAAPPVFFVRADRISFGRPGFRIQNEVPAHGVASGQIWFGVRQGIPTEWIRLVCTLPDGDHVTEYRIE